MGSSRVCLTPGCPNLQPCDVHVPKPWARTSARNAQRAGGNGWAQQRERKRILARDAHRCYVPGCTTRATIVDHVLAVAAGGADIEANKASMCAEHHDAKSKAERRRR